MSPAAHLTATLDLIEAIAAARRPADAEASAWFRAHRHIGDSDRGPMLALAYTLLRHHARLGWWLERLRLPDTPRHRLLAWLALDNTPSSHLEALLRPLPATERALLDKLRGTTIAHPAMPDSVRLECPDWAAAPLQRRFTDRFAAEMEATLAEPPLDLRVNPLRSTREAMLADLRDLGLHPDPTPLSPLGIRLRQRLSLTRLPMLKTGEVEIQDEGSQLVAMLLDAQPGERVVDFCAGAGGKTLAIAAQMRNRGHVVACDVSEMRLKRAAERFRKAGLHNIETRLLASETDRWIKRHKHGFSRVLVDAPCSGTGTWRRNPDARWRSPEDQGLDSLVALQSRILASAARLVKPGGRLVYATCSLLPEENEQQVTSFLANHSDFRTVPTGTILQLDQPYLSLTPAQHGTDGFFAAVMQRGGAEAV
ncbi:RsmB/NOP family class I SAM-dependent RNA methyltransferase [Devosia albogilva]|uniref:RsmB/NOP family class I SAM-dependent RNA methyltransferase n=1 Tax=Devosia albogilva TaxID=429726 RepID=A0ABW5QGU9_9HYPH